MLEKIWYRHELLSVISGHDDDLGEMIMPSTLRFAEHWVKTHADHALGPLL